MASAVVPQIVLTGVMDAILELTVSAVNSSVSIGDSGDVILASATSTPTSLPFGNFAPVGTGGAESKVVAHDIRVVTNVATGYSAGV